MAGKATGKGKAAEVELANDVPTRKDLDTVTVWRELSKKLGKGETPTLAAIAEALGISVTAAKWRLEQCHRKGLFVRRPVTTLGPYEISPEGEKWLKMAG